MTPKARFLMAVLAVTVFAGLAGLYFMGTGGVSGRGPAGETGIIQGSGTPSIGGPFTLVDHTGKTVTERDFLGKFMLIYFGFTYCPDVCPTELQIMAAALQSLGPKAEQIQPVFISVDPERDTPDVLATYVKQFDPRFIGLTGTVEQVAAVSKAYRVFFRKAKDESSSADYSVDHSSIIYLMDREGKFLVFFGPGTSPDEVARKIEPYLGQ